MHNARLVPAFSAASSVATVVVSVALFAACGPALAQAQAQDQGQAGQDPSIRVTGVQQTYRLQPQQIDEIVGQYRFDDGGMFRIVKVGRRLMGQLNARPLTELVAQSDHQLIARDQNIAIDYVAQAFGDELVLSYPSNLAEAGAPLVTVRLAHN